jgi:isocitrate/isopropylmalate dehydrogenase
MSGEMMEREMQQLEAENAELLARLAAQQNNAEQVAVDAVAVIESSSKIWRDLVHDLRKENEELQIYRRAIESMAAQFVHPKTTALELARQILGETE